ncbi:MarR family winged helix-turn-helix transcriptional regulator [Streptomyces boncukensis]|uniref:MarR family transcriptional regulator n=1 Tax=Streptomyces boncukensis TaxID=2711219 RepID=A0A6G4X5T0_9ACTN|nr:MarR family transcriptional regulator [Streptomyces boncukensis]NGO72875.1 MarR family transcriptional regulator [Streptomyces boncukensis]
MPQPDPPPLSPSTGQPLGITLGHTARDVGRAFDGALSAAGGSRPVWLVLLSLVSGHSRNQRELAAAVGIRGATLTHHLNAMEDDGLLVRRRDPENRRVHLVELTEEGTAAFHRMRKAATAFDRQLRQGLSEDELARFDATLARLRANAAAADDTDDTDDTD